MSVSALAALVVAPLFALQAAPAVEEAAPAASDAATAGEAAAPAPASEAAEAPTDAPAPASEGAEPPTDAPAPASEAAELPAAIAPALQEAPRLLVLGVVDKGAGPETTALVNEGLMGQATLSHTGPILSLEQVQAALEGEAKAALEGCDGPQCMSELATRVEAERVLGGTATKTGDDVLLTVLLIEAATGERVAEVQRKVPASDEMLRYAARSMASLALTGRPAETDVPVAIAADHPGAKVIVDGEDKGEAPLLLRLAPGTHEVRVRLAGYSDWRTSATVQEATPLSLTASLVAERLPLWPASLAAGGVAVVAAGSAVVAGLFALDSYDGSLGLTPGAKERSYVYMSPADEQGLAAARQRTQQLEYTGYALWATAAVAVVAAVGLETADLILAGE